MATININRQSNDIFDRYTMHKLQIYIQGSRTFLVNMNEIEKDLKRLPIYILTFFGYEFGTSVQADTQKNRYSISGIRDRATLQDVLYKFIDHFVLCSKCGNPETELVLHGRKTDEVYKQCAACGHLGSENMQRQKLTKFIAKHLRDTTVKRSQEYQAERQEQSNESSANDFEEEDDDNNDNLLSNHPLLILLEKSKNEDKLNDPNTIQEIIGFLQQFNLIDKGSFYIAKYLFNGNLCQEILVYKNLFQQLCENNLEAQLNFLSALEEIIHHRNITNKKTIEEILFNLYNEDIIEEDTFHRWYQISSTHKHVRQLTKGFIEWLNQSD